jgi:hypothetical protein
MELANGLRADTCTQRMLVEGLVIMLSPFAPHFAEESWERFGNATSVFDERWPAWDEGLVVEDQVEVAVAVQVNGKTWGKVTVARDAERGMVAVAQGDAAVRRFTGEGSAEGGVCAESVAEFGGRVGYSPQERSERGTSVGSGSGQSTRGPSFALLAPAPTAPASPARGEECRKSVAFELIFPFRRRVRAGQIG